MGNSNMDRFRELLQSGYVVKRDPFPVSSIVEEGLARQRAGQPIPEDRKFLLDPANWDETIIILVHPTTGSESLVVTREEPIVELARSRYREQFEPVGLWIRAHCEARGTSATNAPIYHVDRFVDPLDGFRGWVFKKDSEPGRFVVSKKLDAVDDASRIAAVAELEHMLDCLAAIVGLGLHIWHLAVSPIPRGVPATSWGKEEHMIPPPTTGELQRLAAYIGTPEVWTIAQGLNRGYCENSKGAKLAALWSSCEQVFSTESERLLPDDVVKRIAGLLDSIDELALDRKALTEVRRLMTDWLKKLKKKTRNELISESIAQLLSISKEKSTACVREAFELRGRFTHSLSDAERPRVDRALAFLHNALQRLLERTCTTAEST